MDRPKWLVIQYYNGEVWELRTFDDEDEALQCAEEGVFIDEEAAWVAEVFRLENPIKSFKNRATLGGD